MSGKKTNKQRIIIALLLIVSVFIVPAAALMVDVSFTELVSGADSVVIGTVASAESRWNEDQTLIRTYSSVSVERHVTGAPVDTTITIVVDGGTVDGMTLWVSDAPTLHPGMRAGFLLREEEPGLYAPYGQIQGVYALENDPVTFIGRMLNNMGLYPGYTSNQFIRDVHSARAAAKAYGTWGYPGWIISGWGMPGGMADQDKGMPDGIVEQDRGKQR